MALLTVKMGETVRRARDEEGTEQVFVRAFIIRPLTNLVWLLTANCFWTMDGMTVKDDFRRIA